MRGFHSFLRHRRLVLTSSFDVGLVLFRLFCNSVPSYDAVFNFSTFILFQPWGQMPENLNVPCLSYRRELVPSKARLGGHQEGRPCPQQGVGMGWSLKSIPTPKILCFCEKMLCLLTALMQKRNKDFNNVFHSCSWHFPPMNVYIPTCTWEVLGGNWPSKSMGKAITLHGFPLNNPIFLLENKLSSSSTFISDHWRCMNL